MPDFDEKLIQRKHVQAAIARYLRERPKHRPSRSAFLIHRGERLPAKMILKMAFAEATGEMPASETLTGGRASVRVLSSLGFETVYDKPPAQSGRRNPVKNRRREAFRRILAERWGEVETERRFDNLCVPDLGDRASLDPVLRRVLEAIESHRGKQVQGRKGHRLAFDLYLPAARVGIEFDERQHFTPLRAAALRAYPADAPLGFDRKRWIALSEEIRAGDNSPEYRDEQRAFYDAIRDLGAPGIGLRPVVRVFEEDVKWEQEGEDSAGAKRILAEIERLARQELR